MSCHEITRYIMLQNLSKYVLNIMRYVFCVRHQKAELGFKMFIISHIAVACQDEIFTVVLCTI